MSDTPNGVQLVLDKITALDTRFADLKAERETYAADKAAIDKALGEIKAELAGYREKEKQAALLSMPGINIGKNMEAGKFSFARMVLACANPGLLTEKEYGYERDVHNEMRKRLEGMPLEYRTAINAATGTGGAFLIPTQAHQELIPQLRERSIARQAGVTVLDGLTPGIHTWAKSRGGVVAEHLNTEEEATGTETVPTFDQIQLQPRPIAAFVPLTYGMQQQAPATLEGWVRGEIATQVGLLEDQSYFVGTGASGAPRGVLRHPNLQFVSFSGVTYTGSTQTVTDKLLDMVLTCRNKFALGLSGLGWVGAPAVTYKLAKAKDSTGRMLFPSLTDSVGDIQAPVRVLRYPLFDSDQVKFGTASTERLAFGPWGDTILAHWGTMAFAMSDQTETNFRKARITVRGIMQYDVGVFHGDAFVHAGSDASTPNFDAS